MLDNVTLTASAGGKGGDGGHAGVQGAGKAGAPGGDSTGSIGAAGGGGRGGNGGVGASGSGGTGGPSYALVTVGGSVTKTQIKPVHADGGNKGLGGSLLGSAGTNPAPDGTQGASGDELAQ
jgi:hypothetical protein